MPREKLTLKITLENLLKALFFKFYVGHVCVCAYAYVCVCSHEDTCKGRNRHHVFSVPDLFVCSCGVCTVCIHMEAREECQASSSTKVTPSSLRQDLWLNLMLSMHVCSGGTDKVLSLV